MKSNKTPGNLRDFHIDERLPESLPSQSVRPRHHVPAPSPARPAPRVESEWSVPDAPASSPQLMETNLGDSLWSSWEQEAASQNSVDLSEPVTVMPSSQVRRVSMPVTSNLRETVPNPALASRSQPAPVESEAPANPQTQGQARTDAAPGSLPWSSELAYEERRMERTGTVDYANQYQKQEILRARTREFTALLQKLFREHVELFNESRRSPAHQIHVYKVSKTDEDFMLYRNGVKLAVSGQRAGRVIFAFNQYLGQIFAPTQAPVVEIEAAWGPFDQLFWSYKGERLQVLDLVRYFLTEFVRQSFR